MGVDHALWCARRARREQQLGDAVWRHGGHRALDGVGGCRLQQLVEDERAIAIAAPDDGHWHLIGERIERGTERPSVFGEDEPWTGQPCDLPDPQVVGAHQGVGDADRHHRNAGGVRPEAHEQVLERISGEDHQGAVGPQAEF